MEETRNPAASSPRSSEDQALRVLHVVCVALCLLIFLAANAPILDASAVCFRYFGAMGTQAILVLSIAGAVGSAIGLSLPLPPFGSHGEGSMESSALLMPPENSSNADSRHPGNSHLTRLSGNELMLLAQCGEAMRIAIEGDPRIQQTRMREMGEVRFLEEVDAERIASDRFGELYHLDRFGFLPPMKLVLVRCPSTSRPYLLRVPTSIVSAHEGVAWSFGLTPDQYAPLVES